MFDAYWWTLSKTEPIVWIMLEYNLEKIHISWCTHNMSFIVIFCQLNSHMTNTTYAKYVTLILDLSEHIRKISNLQ